MNDILIFIAGGATGIVATFATIGTFATFVSRDEPPKPAQPDNTPSRDTMTVHLDDDDAPLIIGEWGPAMPWLGEDT